MWRSQKKPSGTIVPVAGQRQGVRLVNGVLGEFVTLVARARVVVSVAAATAVRNKGSVWALFDEVVVDENGQDRHLYTGPVLRHLSEMNAPSALSARRIVPAADGTVPVGTYMLEEAVRVWFAWPMALDPTETAFVERDPRQSLSLLVRQVANSAAALLTAGGATVAVDQVSVTVTHGFQLPARGAKAPLFIPTARQQVVQIAGAVTQQAEYIRSPGLIRAIVLSQEVAGVGEVSDILTGVVLRGDFTTPIGPGIESFRDQALESEFDMGGTMVQGLLSPHLGFNFQKYGRLSNCLNPAQDTNLRFEFAGAPSAVAGGASQVRITLLELQQVAGITNPAPFPY